jgi:hypothetical protein
MFDPDAGMPRINKGKEGDGGADLACAVLPYDGD